VLAVGQNSGAPGHLAHRPPGGNPAQMTSRFVFLRVHPASQVHRRAADFGDLPVRWLIAEWPPG
jgi:hypothetical protein